MSHISKIDTKIKSLECLKKALEALNMKYVEATENERLTLHGYGKNEEIEDCIFEIKTGSKYSIGIRKKENNSCQQQDKKSANCFQWLFF